ncbi:unnamed protein product [Arabidopsis halleri]
MLCKSEHRRVSPSSNFLTFPCLITIGILLHCVGDTLRPNDYVCILQGFSMLSFLISTFLTPAKTVVAVVTLPFSEPSSLTTL